MGWGALKEEIAAISAGQSARVAVDIPLTPKQISYTLPCSSLGSKIGCAWFSEI